MASQEVKITGIDSTVIGSVGWAKETTLQRLANLTEEQTNYLAKLAQETRKQSQQTAQAANNATGSTKKLGQAADDAADAVDDVADALDKLAREEERRNRKKRSQEYRDYQNLQSGVGNLRSSLQKLERATPADMFGTLTDKITVAGGRLTDMSGGASFAGKALTLFGKSLAVASFGVGALVAGLDPFRQLFDAGISFGGSIEQMQIDVNKTGVGLQDFTRIALQYGHTISSIGGQNFSELVRKVQDGTRSFGRYGQSVTAQTESIAAFTTILASGGSLYRMSVDEQTEAAQKYLKEQTALTLLTGKSRKQMEEEQRKTAARAEVDLAIRAMEARGDKEGADALRQLKTTVTGIYGESAGVAAVQEALGRTTTETGLRDMLSISGQYDPFRAMATQYRTLTPEQITQTMLQIGRGVGSADNLGMLSLQAGTTGKGGQIAQFTSQFQQAGDAFLNRTAPERARAQRILEGTESGLDRTTLAMEQISGDFARITGDLKATFFTVAQKLGIFSTGAPLVAGATGMGAQASTGLLDFGNSGVMQSLGILGLYMGGRMLKGMLARRGIDAAAGALRTPALPQMAGPPPPPALPAAARAAPGLMTLAPRVGGLAMAGGLAGGALLGAGGAYQAAYGQDRASRMMGIGTSALSGAMMGAMFGLPGMLIGGALGAGVGAAANYYGAGGAAAEPGGAMGGDFGAGLTALNATIARGNTEIVFWLKSIDSKMQSVDAGLGRAGRALGAMQA